MSQYRPLVFALAFPMCVVAILSVGGTTKAKTAARVTTQEATIPQPDSWVAFDADFVDTQPGRSRDVSGRYYRSGDGSDRSENYSTRGDTAIRIINVGARESYFYASASGKWFRQAVDIPPEGYRPPAPRRATMTGLKALPQRLEDMEVYEYRRPRGGISIQAPALNFFSLQKTEVTGQQVKFFNVKVRPQDPALFQAPANAIFEDLAQHVSLGMRVPRDPAKKIVQPTEHGRAPTAPKN